MKLMNQSQKGSFLIRLDTVARHKDTLQVKLPGGLSKELKGKKKRKVTISEFTASIAFLPRGCS